MYRYQLYGLQLETDLELKQLIAGSSRKPADITIVSGEIPSVLQQKETQISYEFGETICWLSNNTCRLLAENGNKLTYSLKENGNPDYLKTYLLGWGMSMLGLQRGYLAIHCSAVANEHGAILICGESGTGKSTVTSSFLEKGYRLMADDMAFVETGPGEPAYSFPAFPYQKLCRDAALARGYSTEELIYIDEEKDKFLVPYKGKFELTAVPVRGMLVLGVVGGEEMIVREITGLNRFHMVADNLFLRKLLGTRKYEPRTGQLCLNMAASVPMAYIGRPAGYDTVDEVVSRAFAAVAQW